ncbi:hypothetical protein OIU78_022114 [Salix suchowensis]|nr:hypothetical protein OIU78_022114 [Salix suchowensis]
MFSCTKSSSVQSSFVDDIFGGLNGSSSLVNNNNEDDDIFGAFTSSSKAAKQSAPVNDLVGGSGTKIKPPSRNGSVGFDDLIPGFGSRNSSRKEKNMHTATSAFTSSEDPFANRTCCFIKLFPTIETPSETRTRFEDRKRVSQSSSVPKSSSGALDPLFDARINVKGKPKFPFKKASSPSPGIKKTSTTNALGDLSSIFGDATLSGDFEEIEGESEERRRARWDRHQRTRDSQLKIHYEIECVLTLKIEFVFVTIDEDFYNFELLFLQEQAVAHMNQRDLQTLHEQEERRCLHPYRNTCNGVKSKLFPCQPYYQENVLRATRSISGLASTCVFVVFSVQEVLWPECDWEPVSLTDLITSTSVKKVYRKATSCVHPDKVQQKGSLEQVQ